MNAMMIIIANVLFVLGSSISSGSSSKSFAICYTIQKLNIDCNRDWNTTIPRYELDGDDLLDDQWLVDQMEDVDSGSKRSPIIHWSSLRPEQL